MFTFLLSPSSLFLFHFPPNFSSLPTVCISVPQFYCIGQDLVKLELGEMGFPPFCHNLSPPSYISLKTSASPSPFPDCPCSARSWSCHCNWTISSVSILRDLDQTKCWGANFQSGFPHCLSRLFLFMHPFFPISLSSLHFHLIFLPAPTSASTSQKHSHPSSTLKISNDMIYNMFPPPISNIKIYLLLSLLGWNTKEYCYLCSYLLHPFKAVVTS